MNNSRWDNALGHLHLRGCRGAWHTESHIRNTPSLRNNRFGPGRLLFAGVRDIEEPPGHGSAEGNVMTRRTKRKRKRGQIIPKGSSDYLVRVYRGMDRSTGKRLYSAKKVDGTYKQAERELTKLLHNVDSGTYREPWATCQGPIRDPAGTDTGVGASSILSP